MRITKPALVDEQLGKLGGLVSRWLSDDDLFPNPDSEENTTKSDVGSGSGEPISLFRFAIAQERICRVMRKAEPVHLLRFLPVRFLDDLCT
ncbi:hypothetical protein T265_11542 [Opisthorchis viverrini]|uniref:Uncharacterized protein n=1 Tax=Opisthorchis viverrini TaxID=6198 RepID=A0A074Z2M8_OPIVI|nr:hypothetical protein T265_11542 [Opisthorchis viverrini]KER19762.1 hypothetical protein T265_11542 [Opisthorchis viverrini]